MNNTSIVLARKFTTLNLIYRLPVVKRFYCISKEADEPELPRNVIPTKHTAHLQPQNGEIAGKKPFRLVLTAGKTYVWCLCGHGHEQPFCDGTHKNNYMNIKLRPIRFQVEKTKEYWLCTCKQTKNRPFCDGTHKRPDIQEKKV